MATLERIRKRSGLLIVVIGLAMGAFILTDLLSSGGILFNDTNNMGSINGEKITRQDFITQINKLRKSNPQYAQFSEKTMADAVWNQLERDKILGAICEDLGLTITPAELKFNIQNSPEIARAFVDENTGQFSEAKFNNYYNSLEQAYLEGNDPKAVEGWFQWVAYEKGIKQQSLASKYNTAVQYGIYIPSILGKEEYIKSSETVQGNFVQLPFSSIPDSSVSVSDSDINSYYNSHKEDFETEASRSFDYITFDILPSQEDINEVLVEMSGLLEDKIESNKVTGANDTIIGFRNTPDDSTYVGMYSDTPFEDKFYLKGELPANVDTIAFYNEVGFVEGPVLEGNSFAIFKVNKIINKPDSVKARHILIAYAGAKNAAPTVTRAPQEAQLLADSLLKVITDDISTFDAISTTSNDDIIAQGKGGDLGWFDEGSKGPSFDRFAFRNKVGEVGLAYSEYGVHIVVLDETMGSNKAVRMATIRRSVNASQNTIENLHREAAIFASEAQKSEDYTALAQEKGYFLNSATDIMKGDENIANLGQNREIVKWAFNEERVVKDINVFSTNNQHITVILTKLYEEGTKPLADVEDLIKLEVIKEKQAEILIQKIKDANATDINSLASALGVDAKPQATSMTGSALSGVGSEPKVIGVFSGVKPNTLSEPIVGNTGVFVVTIQERTPVLDKPDYAGEQSQIQSQIRDLVQTQIFASLRETADIDDKHNDIY